MVHRIAYLSGLFLLSCANAPSLELPSAPTPAELPLTNELVQAESQPNEPAAETQPGGDDDGSVPNSALGSNILILIADDLGRDNFGLYGLNEDVPPTPNLDALAERGVFFRNAYSYSVCSPTRSSIATGRYGRRTGITHVVRPWHDYGWLSDEALTMPEMLQSSAFDYDTSLIGKWHLTSYQQPDWESHPNRAGFDHFQGSPYNVSRRSREDSGDTNYFRWEEITNSVLTVEEGYATTDETSDAIARVEVMAEPWLLWVGFNAVHSPVHNPPAELHSYELDESSASPVRYDAMVESLDTEIGRLLSAIDPEVMARTTVIFVSDNGTYRSAITPPFNRSRGKGTMFELGINIPLIVAGPAVAEGGTVSTALVHTVDIFATVADVAGVDITALTGPTGAPLAIDGVSLLPHVSSPDAAPRRDYVYTETRRPNAPAPAQHDERVVRDERWKLIRGLNRDRFYDLTLSPHNEGRNLLRRALTPEQDAAYQRLSEIMDAQIEALVYEGF